jgi:Zn-finger protein
MNERDIFKAPPRGQEYAFFSHKTCEYFPCHKTDDPENFNCLFCYCPLYALGERCGGSFTYTRRGIKDCSACTIPHRRGSLDDIKGKFGEIAELAKKRK